MLIAASVGILLAAVLVALVPLQALAEAGLVEQAHERGIDEQSAALVAKLRPAEEQAVERVVEIGKISVESARAPDALPEVAIRRSSDPS